jgi:hypothetical protein
MTYLGYIKKLRLKTRWDDGCVDHRITGPNAQWDLLIICGKINFIYLKSIDPPTVAYYRQGIVSKVMRDKLALIGANMIQMDGESLTTAPLDKLPELCKIVKAKKKRSVSPEQLEKMTARLKDFADKRREEIKVRGLESILIKN